MNDIVRTIDASEEVVDPLEGLVEQTRLDPGAPFQPEVREALGALRLNDRPAYEKLRAELKRAKGRVTELDKLLEGADAGGRTPQQTQATNLTELLKQAELFTAEDGTCFADIRRNGHRETWEIRSPGFRNWLTSVYYEAFKGAPNNDAISAALNMAEAICRASGVKREVFLRVGCCDGKHYLDLCDEEWRVVQIDSEGWRIVADAPVRFRRTNNMKQLPPPHRGGTLADLRSLVNTKDDDDFVLTVAWLLAALRNKGPYPLLAVSGEQGSAKTMFISILKALIDPCDGSPRTMSGNERDFYILAKGNHVLAFDNLSKLSDFTSDSLCRMSTGGGIGLRQLYTDAEEIVFKGPRPVAFNGIEDLIARPDLADRAILLTLDPIPEEERRLQSELWADLERRQPSILGALLDAMVVGLKRFETVELPTLPRMADFAKWAVACEPAFTTEGSFLAAYSENRERAIDDVMETDAVAVAVQKLMADVELWRGTATELMDALALYREINIMGSDDWPTQPNKLAGRLRRVAPTLRKRGIEVTTKREGRESKKIITIGIPPEEDPIFESEAFAEYEASLILGECSWARREAGGAGDAVDQVSLFG